jgi:predicted nucleic acid-binding protein
VVLVDTSVWINHFKSGNNYLSDLLLRQKVLVHPFVVGELACGSLKNREIILQYLDDLPKSLCPDHDEAINFLNARELYSKGLGWIDINLLLSTIYSESKLWTMDQRLRAIAIKSGVNYSPIRDI